MRTATAVVAGIAVAVVGLGGGRALSRTAAAEEPIAFVNLNRVFKASPRARKVSEGLQKKADELKERLAKREESLRKQAQDAEVVYDTASTQYADAVKEINRGLWEIDYEKKSGMERILQEQVREMDAVYRDVGAEVARIAEARGCGCVLNWDTDPVTVEEKGQTIGLNELKLQMALRPVLWAKPSLDITQDVIDALHARGGGTKAEEKGAGKEGE